ncbi:micronuclear linker histone polyprotein-like [Achroia grisella]|uniref:micronuclear linker histone polyprotein-like n=1 Tax=Achroia grisella TaxID=688607 RepID=UPI0027D2C050|nr:micronuclear linker histone polyprotein-like [Achroia grisella]
MSTRSGKRIHGSFHDNEQIVNTEFVAKTERKTRNKRQKENAEDTVLTTAKKSKKRNNYVSYPTDDETAAEMGVSNEIEGHKPRVLRSNMLKEQDLNVSNREVETVKTKNIRSTRRTRKFSENILETVFKQAEKAHLDVELENNETGIGKAKKSKKKKAKEHMEIDVNEGKIVSKKQSKKRRQKRTSTNDANAKNNSLNRSDSSNGSYYSAAGSPPSVHSDGHKKANSNISELDTNTEIEHVEIISKNKNKNRSTIKNIEVSINKNEVEDSNKNCTFQETKSDHLNDTFDKETRKKRKSNIQNGIYEADISNKSHSGRLKSRSSDVYEKLNNTFDKGTHEKFLKSDLDRKSQNKTHENSIEEREIINTPSDKATNKRKSLRSNSEVFKSLNNTFDKSDNKELVIFNSTFEKDNGSKNSTLENGSKNFAGNLNTTFEKVDNDISERLNTTFEKDKPVTEAIESGLNTTNTINNTSEESTDNQLKINTTFDKEETKLNSTFDKTTPRNSIRRHSKSSLITSDDTDNLTFDKSNDNSRISVSDDSGTENIVNTTPVLIESSIDESRTNSLTDSSKKTSDVPITPLKREGTFTKDDPKFANKATDSPKRTPSKRITLSTPGSTPFPFSKSSEKEKSRLNVTRSIERAARRSLSLDIPSNAASRTTKVMFCSPVNNPAVVLQQRRKVIKSNLKGSNKSFVFNEDGNATRAAPRKRSYTQNDADDERAKRKRLADDQQLSVNRLSRPRTPSATGKPEPTTPSKSIPTPSKSKSDTKISRTKLPNFAALHQRRFEKMESLDECQERKAKRARQLLVPTAPITVLERSSPRGSLTSSEPLLPKDKKPDQTVTKKLETPTKKLPTLDSLKPGYTRFGFKMNVEVNPFSIPTKIEVKPKESKPKGIARQVTLPSLTGTTRREAAKQTVMREKSFSQATEKRDVKRKESRSIIKGVRTNRRFDLQMKMRNIN